MSITLKALEDELLRAQRNNRITSPPVAMAGIGQFQSALVPAMFGGLSLSAPAANQPLSTTPQKLTGFDVNVPNGPDIYHEGVLPSDTDDAVYILQKGLYLVTVTLNANVAAGVAYSIALYRNGVSTGFGSAVDLSNQSTFASFSFSYPVQASTTDFLELYGTSDNATPQTFTMQNSLFFITRIR